MALRYNTVTGQFEQVDDENKVALSSPTLARPDPGQDLSYTGGSFGLVQQPAGTNDEVVRARQIMSGQTYAQGGGVDVDLEKKDEGAASNPESGRLGVNDFLALANQGGGGGGPRVSQTIRQEMPLGPQTPEQQAQYDALARERAGIEERRTEAEEALKDVTVDREVLKAKEFDQYRQKIDSFNEEMTQKQQKMQGISKGLEGAYKQKREEVKNAQIDPDGFWKEKGTLGRMLGAIAIGMGQFGASMTGSRNAALDIVNDAINRNIQAQLQKIQTGKEDLGQAKEDYLNQLSRTDQIEAKTSLIKDQMYTDYIRRLDAQLSVTEDQEARGKLELMIQDADEARNAASQQSLQKIMGNVVVEKKQVSGGGGRSAGAKLKAVNQALDAAKKYKELTDPATGKKSIEIPGFQGSIEDKTQAAKFREKALAYRNLKTLLEKAKTFRDKYGPETLNRDAVKEASTLHGQMRLNYQQMIKGTPSNKDAEVIDEMIPRPDAYKFGVMRQFEVLEQTADDEFGQTLDIYGLTPQGGGDQQGYGFGQ